MQLIQYIKKIWNWKIISNAILILNIKSPSRRSCVISKFPWYPNIYLVHVIYLLPLMFHLQWPLSFFKENLKKAGGIWGMPTEVTNSKSFLFFQLIIQGLCNIFLRFKFVYIFIIIANTSFYNLFSNIFITNLYFLPL